MFIGYKNVVLSIYIVIQFQGKFENFSFDSNFLSCISLYMSFIVLDLISFCLNV